MNNLQNTLTILERLTGPTPKFFQTIRNVGIILSAVSGLLMSLQTQGIDLPEALVVLADKAYLLAGAITTLISSLTIDVDAYKKQNALK